MAKKKNSVELIIKFLKNLSWLERLIIVTVIGLIAALVLFLAIYRLIFMLPG